MQLLFPFSTPPPWRQRGRPLSSRDDSSRLVAKEGGRIKRSLSARRQEDRITVCGDPSRGNEEWLTHTQAFVEGTHFKNCRRHSVSNSIRTKRKIRSRKTDNLGDNLQAYKY
ncbi:hypothetical protein HNY73_013794 [Argiope bruennichi]|uniref:Uncharacterized protein n=1 Tax=Argiope bruennichi TaxID=94029 RepID=A0A8T0EN95_ARGBR|nr:hypothetical protein HNY73_013794 [Argiope bruennichi]